MIARVGRVLLRGLVVVLLLAVAAVLVWLRPFTADSRALAVLADPAPGVEVVDSATTVRLLPAAEPSGVGLVMQPGARVDHRAYLALLQPFAQAGHLVVVVKQPMFIGFTATDAPLAVFEQHPEITSWVLAGHSLGGVAASSLAAEQSRSAGGEVDGLLLWASYPLGDISGSGLQVLSVSGSEDGLSTPADIDASRALLPADAGFVEVQGATHAYFGDYGEQSGDGTATVDRATAQAEIVRAGLQLLDGLARDHTG